MNKVTFVSFTIIIIFGLSFRECANHTKIESECPNKKSDVSLLRKRRHLVFPDGSSFTATLSLVKAFMTHAPSGWNFVMEVDVIFPLQDAKFTKQHSRRLLHHRQKRQLWERIQDAMDSHNLNGRSCVIRSICEAQHLLAPRGRSLIHDLLRAVFTAPLHEKDFRNEISAPYQELLEADYCGSINDCPLSLLHFVLSLNKEN